MIQKNQFLFTIIEGKHNIYFHLFVRRKSTKTHNYIDFKLSEHSNNNMCFMFIYVFKNLQSIQSSIDQNMTVSSNIIFTN